MKKLVILLGLVCCLGARAQDAVESQLEELYYQEQYDKIITRYAPHNTGLLPKAPVFVVRTRNNTIR